MFVEWEHLPATSCPVVEQVSTSDASANVASAAMMTWLVPPIPPVASFSLPLATAARMLPRHGIGFVLRYRLDVIGVLRTEALVHNQ